MRRRDARSRRRTAPLVVVVALGVAASVGAVTAPGPAHAAGDAAARVLTIVNDERAARGLPALGGDGAAHGHAQDVAAEQRDAGRLSHTPPDRLAAWYVPPYDRAAEALGYTTSGSPEAVVDGWMASDTHRRILLAPAYDYAGVGAVTASDGSLWVAVHVLDGNAPPPPQAASDARDGASPAAATRSSSRQGSGDPRRGSVAGGSSSPVASAGHDGPPADVRVRAVGAGVPVVLAALRPLDDGGTDRNPAPASPPPAAVAAALRHLFDAESSCDGTGCTEVRPAGRKQREGGVMYHFAVIALLALAAVKLVDFVADNVRQAERMRSLMTFVAAIGGVWILDYSLFEGWAVSIRNADVGVWITGFVVAGLTVPWRAVFGYLSHHRATADETLGEHTPIRKAA